MNMRYSLAPPLTRCPARSLHQTRSTSSNLIKEQDTGDEELSGVSQLAQPPTSLLDLPDDILHLILKEVHEERQTVITTNNSLPVAEVLINKRIFSLARSIWFRHLSIDESQPGSSTRSTTQRCIMAQFHPLPGCCIEQRLCQPPQIHYPGVATYVAWEFKGITCFIDAQEGPRLLTCMTARWAEDRPFDFNINWPSTLSLDLQSGCGKLPHAAKVLRGLEAATQGGKVLPLKRLKLDLRLSCDIRPPSEIRFFNRSDYQQLVKLLQHTNLQQLHLASLDYIPEIPSNVEIRSMRILRLSGPCNLRQSDSFLNLSTLLLAFPSLTQLRLVGSAFFGTGSSADIVSQTTETSLIFRYPELNALLTHLQRSNVVIFTYRGQNEKREVRWTRMHKNEEFDRDCWTL
ncbi:hypothetical protein JCM5353_007252 [Sporobolomyces roseus]